MAKKPKGFGKFDSLMRRMMAERTEMTPEERNKLVGAIAGGIGKALGQEYVSVDRVWWLFTGGKPARALKPDEVEWHVARNHAPFVDGGITPDDPHWWDDPK